MAHENPKNASRKRPGDMSEKMKRKKDQRCHRNTETETATGGGKNLHRCELKNFTGKRKTMQAFAWLYYGGLYWTRTSDPIDVNDVLYQLSQQTNSLGTKDSIA